MCGIYGYDLKKGIQLTDTEFATLHAVLSVAMESRGHQSFGYAYRTASGEMEVIKQACSITSGAYSALAKVTAQCTSLFAHTRFATQGKVKKANAHPFRVGEIVGVHNGVIYNHFELNHDLKRDCAVDSQHIFAHISEGRSLNELEGYGAICYANALHSEYGIRLGKFNDGQLNIVRLYRGKDHIGVMWCSEYAPLWNAASLCGMRVEGVKIKQGRWYLVSNGEVFKTDGRIDIQKGFEMMRDWRTEGKKEGKQVTAGATASGSTANGGQKGARVWQVGDRFGDYVYNGEKGWSFAPLSHSHTAQSRGQLSSGARTRFSMECEDCGCAEDEHLDMGDSLYCCDCGQDCKLEMSEEDEEKMIAEDLEELRKAMEKN